MYRMLMVDDEPIIIDGLLKVISTLDDIDLDVRKAYSVPDALQILETTKIDIAIIDIRIDDRTGLELHEEIMRLWPNCKVIFLTGFDQFEYVQKVIRNEAVDFILKTEDDGQIVRAIRKAVDRLQAEFQVEQLVEKSKYFLRQSLPLLQNDFLSRLLEGMDCSMKERRARFHELEIPLDSNKPVLLLLGRIDGLATTIGYEQKLKSCYGVINVVKEYLERDAICFAVHFESNKLLWLVQPKHRTRRSDSFDDSANEWARVAAAANAVMDPIQTTIEKTLNISVSILLSGKETSWENAWHRLEVMTIEMNRSAGIRAGALMVDASGPDDPNGETGQVESREEYLVRMQLRKTRVLGELLDAGQEREFMDLYATIMKQISACSSLSISLYREAFYAVSLVFLSYFNRVRPAIPGYVFPTDLDKLTRIELHSGWDEIATYFRDLAKMIFAQKTSEAVSRIGKVIETVNRYVEKNLDKDLSLTRLSEICYFNPSYLSRIYKQTTGKALSEYISETKLLKAKTLLKQSNMKILDIARALGFGTPSYFTYFFKKYTGENPHEYRGGIAEEEPDALRATATTGEAARTAAPASTGPTPGRESPATASAAPGNGVAESPADGRRSSVHG